MIRREDFPRHLFEISELDLSSDLLGERIVKPWFRLGAWTIGSHQDASGVQDVIQRESLLVPRNGFSAAFVKLEKAGSASGNYGKVGGYTSWKDGETNYGYAAFHSMKLNFSDVLAEGLVFRRFVSSRS